MGFCFLQPNTARLLGRDIQAFTDEEIEKYFRLYNIAAVVAFLPASMRRLTSVPGLNPLDRRIGPVHLMRVN